MACYTGGEEAAGQCVGPVEQAARELLSDVLGYLASVRSVESAFRAVESSYSVAWSAEEAAVLLCAAGELAFVDSSDDFPCLSNCYSAA